MRTPLRILIVEDSKDDAILVSRELKRGGYDPTFERVDTATAMEAMLEQQTWDIVIAGYEMSQFNGLAALELMQKRGVDLPFIIVSDAIGVEMAVEAIKAGAHDYVKKENLARLVPVVERELHKVQVRQEHRQAEEALRKSEEKYRSLTDNILDSSATGILILDAGFRVVWVNQALERYFHLQQDEIIGQDQRQLVRDRLKNIFEDPETFAKKVFATYDDNTYQENFECHVLPNGERQERWLEHRSQPIRSGLYAGGRIEHYYGITKRKRAEIELETHARQQAALFHLSAELVATLDETDICQKVVHGLHHTLGYDHVGLLLLDETTGERVLQANTGLVDIPSDLRLRPGQGLSEQPLLDGRAHYTPDVTGEPRYFPGLKDGRSEVDIPLQAGEKILGVLVVESRRVNAFSKDDFAVLTAAANQTAMALERARQHQAVKEAEIRYQSLFDRVPVGLYRTTPEGRFLDANPALVEMLGYPDRGAFLAASATKLYVNTEDRQRWQALIEREGVVRDFEVQMYRREGTIIWVRNSARVVHDEDGEGPVLYYEGSLEDITEHKRAEEEIRRRNRELALLNRVIAASAASLEPKAILETVCRELALAFDLPQAVAVLFNEEKTAGRVVADYPAEGGPPTLKEAIPFENVPMAQYILTHKTHLVISDVQSDPRVAPLRDLARQYDVVSALILPLIIGEEVIGLLALEAIKPRQFLVEEIDLARSVADQVAGALARVRLGEEHRRLSTAIEQTAESVAIIDAEAIILYVNPAFEQVTGYRRAEVVGQKASILKNDDAFHQEMWDTIRAGRVWHGQATNRKKDGTLYTDETTITPVRNESGEITNYVAVQRDVTRELELEEHLRQSQKMKAIGQLTAGIAHDFNNLLTAINGFAELIQHQLPSDSEIYDMVGKILHSGRHAADLVRQLLAFSRKQVIRPKILNLNSIVTNVNQMLQRIIGESIELEVILTPNLWLVEVDPAQIEQVIINLAVNARDAMPDGGKLTIETANVILDDDYVADHLGAQAGEHILLSVSDTGCGMSKEVQAHIFEPFFTTKELHEGTGLGLSTVFGIVKQSGGNIWVYSEEGMGATFKIYLPRVAEAVDPSRQPIQTADLPRGTETILLVEDEALVRELAAQVLQEQGYTILEASNGQDALRLAIAYTAEIHLLLTDVVMPRMGGKVLADRIKAIYPNIKTLFTSGYTDNAIVSQGVLAADIAFIQKPFTSAALANKVRDVLDSLQ